MTKTEKPQIQRPRHQTEVIQIKGSKKMTNSISTDKIERIERFHRQFHYKFNLPTISTIITGVPQPTIRNKYTMSHRNKKQRKVIKGIKDNWTYFCVSSKSNLNILWFSYLKMWDLFTLTDFFYISSSNKI